MNVLGHPYVAWKVVGRLNKYLVAGSHLPDLVPFVPNSIFSFEEIHESPEKVLRFLEKKYPYARDLALGMMTHSVKFGADKFSREIEEWLLADNTNLRNELLQDILDSTGVGLETAKKLLHNYLWCGVDVHLLKAKLELVRDLAETHQLIDLEETSRILSECFKKDEKEVRRMVDYFFLPLKPGQLVSVKGLVEIWKKHAAGLKEKIVVDEEKTLQLAEKIYALFEDRWEGILEKVVIGTKKNLKPFI